VFLRRFSLDWFIGPASGFVLLRLHNSTPPPEIETFVFKELARVNINLFYWKLVNNKENFGPKLVQTL
jgi:hypothetical protein